MSTVLYEKKGHIAVITLNNPKVLNALSTDFVAEIHKAVDEVDKDKEIYVLIVTGVEKAFVAGADIKQMLPLSAVEAIEWNRGAAELNVRLENLRVPVIAAVNGFALGGGCELAMACDIRIASEKAKFGQPECGLGITPGAGGTQRLPRLVGAGKAKELLYTGKIIGAQEACSIGLGEQRCGSGIADGRGYGYGRADLCECPDRCSGDQEMRKSRLGDRYCHRAGI